MIGLAHDLDVFYLDHRQCGDLDAGVEGPIVWTACRCGARMVRRGDEPDDARRA
jgi:hypothetical protein